MTDNLTVDPRATPLGRAITALEGRIRQSIVMEPRIDLPNASIGQPFAATLPELARVAAAAMLDAEEIARAIDPRAFEPKTRRSSFARYLGAQRAALQKASAVRAMVLGTDAAPTRPPTYHEALAACGGLLNAPNGDGCNHLWRTFADAEGPYGCCVRCAQRCLACVRGLDAHGPGRVMVCTVCGTGHGVVKGREAPGG